jgi:putative nucleotidyltransferase-like protein
MSERARIGRALLAAMREDGAAARSAAAGTDPQRLATAARYHGSAGYLHAALEHPSADPAALDAVSTVHHLGIGISMRALVDLQETARILDGAGVRWLLVKGPAVAERLYPDPALRAYEDLDVVVPPGEFPRAIDALESAGCRMVDRNWKLLRREMRGQVHLTLPHGSVLDLHWHLINRDRGPFSLRMEEIFDRARTVPIAGRAMRTTSAEDTLLHLCIHAALSGANRLVWAKDVERAIVVDEPAWDVVVERARASGAGLATAAMLHRASSMFGAPVPEGVPPALGAPVRRMLDRAASRGFHLERSRGSRSGAAMATRLAARAPAASTAAYLRRLGSLMVRGRAGGGDPILAPGGDEGDRRAFLEGVAHTPHDPR